MPKISNRRRTTARKSSRMATSTAARSKNKTTKAPATAPKRGKTKLDVSKPASRTRTKKATPPKQAKIQGSRTRPVKLKTFKPRDGGIMTLPETEQTLRGKTLRQLLRNTPRLFVNNSKEVHINKMKYVRTRTGRPAVEANCETLVPIGNRRTMRRKHQVHIVGMDDTEGAEKRPINRHRKVMVQCSCENFVFMWEYANAHHGCSRIIYGNGEPPTVTNPGLAHGMCKHLVAVAHKLIADNK